ncbi:MAG: hypothetical protein FWF31_06085 [Desulfobulbus sp.]|nr:hypothetical protein [Desulfobulbus sp.]
MREAKDRVRAAIKNADYSFPQHRITVNLATWRSKRRVLATICLWPRVSWRRPAWWTAVGSKGPPWSASLSGAAGAEGVLPKGPGGLPGGDGPFSGVGGHCPGGRGLPGRTARPGG